MNLGSGNAEAFYHQELAGLDLRDKRLVNRAKNILLAMQKNLTSCVRRLYTEPHEARQAYDFFSNQKVSPEALLSTHYNQSVQRIHEHTAPGYLLLIQDGMRFNYTSHTAKTELGRIGKAQGKDQYGLIQHSTLCVTEQNEPLGLLDIQFFHYDELDTTRHHHHRPVEEKATRCWLTALKNARKRLGECRQTLVTIADREGDFFEFLSELHAEGEAFIVRSKHNRYTGESHRAREAKIKERLEMSPIQGQITRFIQDVNTREMKEITLNLKAIRIQLPPPNLPYAQIFV